MIIVTCPRCLGSGEYAYHMIHGTVCFKCMGKGEIQYTETQHKAIQKRANKAMERQELKREEMQANAAISAKIIDTLIARYADTSEFQRRISNNPDSRPLQMDAAIRMFCVEKGIKSYSWIGELARYL